MGEINLKIAAVVGARPNFMKIAPILKEIEQYPGHGVVLVHTGQHYDIDMSKVFFDNFSIPEPDYNLGIGSGPHGEQTGKIMIEFEKVCIAEQPDIVLVVGDVNSTLAGAIVAKKLHIKVAHIESGLRSFDMHMPEEINRLLTDAVSDYLFVSEQVGIDNLRNEGISQEKQFLVGDIMIDALLLVMDKIKAKNQYREFSLEKNKYIVVTAHRPANVDDRDNLAGIIGALKQLDKKYPLVFPIHPRTKKNIEKFGFEKDIDQMKNLIITEPQDYISFMSLISDSKSVITDSGGLQSEAAYLGKPCITLRDTTEKPATIKCGSNRLVGNSADKVIEAVDDVLSGRWGVMQVPDLFDGQTSQRILSVLLDSN